MTKRHGTRLVFALAMGTAFVVLTSPAPAGDLDPSGPPAPTMKTLDQIPATWSRILPADDGDASGCNSSRFECVLGDLAVLDKETGLVWERSPSAAGTAVSWATAGDLCIQKTLGDRLGWRLPTVAELLSLYDPTAVVPSSQPRLPDGHPFTDVLVGSNRYWSATTWRANTDNAYAVHMYGIANLGKVLKSSFTDLNTWCVRGGVGYDGVQ